MKSQSTNPNAAAFFNNFKKLANLFVNQVINGKDPSLNEAISGHQKVSNFLVNYLNGGIKSSKFDPDMTDADGNNWLNLVILLSYPELVQLLIDNKIDVNKANKQGETPLVKGIKGKVFDNDPKVLNLLLDNGANVLATKPEDNKIILDFGLEKFNSKLLDSILTQRPEIIKSNIEPSLVWSIIQSITKENNTQVLEVLNILAKHSCNFGDKGWVAQHKEITFTDQATSGQLTVRYDFSTQAGMQISGGMVKFAGAYNPSYSANLQAPFFSNYDPKACEIILTKKNGGGFSMGNQKIEEVVRKKCPNGQHVSTPFTYLCGKFIKENNSELKDVFEQVATYILDKQISLNQFNFDFHDNNEVFVYFKTATLFIKSPKMLDTLIKGASEAKNIDDIKNFYDEILCKVAKINIKDDDSEEFALIIKTLIDSGADMQKAVKIAQENDNNEIIKIMVPLIEAKIKELQQVEKDPQIGNVGEKLAQVNLDDNTSDITQKEENQEVQTAGNIDDQ